MVDYKGKIYDCHTLHVDCNIAENEQIGEIIDQVIESMSNILNRKVICNYYVNVTRNSSGISNQIAYVWIDNPEVYNVIIGKNPDGSERREMVECLTPIRHSMSASDAWADMVEEEENNSLLAQGINEIKHIEYRPLPPLIQIPEFRYTDEQKIELANGTDELIPYGGKVIFNRAFAPILGEDEVHNLLFAHKIPEFVKEFHIREEFLPFCTKIENKKDQKKPYPIVTINRGGSVRVTFHPDTNDAQFALYIKKKLYWSTPEDENIKIVTIFYQGRSKPNNNSRY